MAPQAKNSVEPISVRGPDLKPSLSPSSSSSSSSSSPPNPTSKCCVHASDFYSAHLTNQNDSNFKRSASPARLMNYRNGSWIDFSREVVDSLKSTFLEHKPIVDVKIEGSKYMFDFLRMVQIDFETGKQRSIAWVDVNGNCFFPKIFIGEEDEDCLDKSESNTMAKIGIEINLNNNLGKRQRDADDEVNSADALKRQRSVSYGVDYHSHSASPKWLNARLLRETEKAYTLVRDYFLAGIRKLDAGATITSIHQCIRVSHLERARFEVFQKQIEVTEAARGGANAVYAWYGASPSGVDSILAHGFGVPSKVSTHGVGIYLSPVGLPGLSAKLPEVDENGEKHVILCRVILGNVEKVEAGSQQCYPSNVDFDSGSDDPNNPKWYIVWPCNMNRHILPECVVSYKPSAALVQGQLSGPACTKYPLEKLFSKMRSSLSPAKLQQVMNLFHTYKAGKLAKNNFFKQLRVVAGDEMLRSTIREIRASE